MALAATDRKDDVKLGQALLRLNEEDPSLTMIHNPQTHDIVLWGQGEMHLRVALERLRERFGVNVKSHPPAIGYQETIRKSITQRGRHKKQSGGHGQFGDVVLEIKPMPRGGGFEFHEKVVGGAVPRNYIGAVEEGVVDGLLRGPLGFPVIDVQVTLTDGSYHSVGFLRSCVPHRGADRRQRSAAAVPAGAAGADPCGRDRLSDRRHRQDQRHPVGAARANSRFRHPRGLAGMGSRPRHDAGSRDRRVDRGVALGDRGRRQFYAGSSTAWPRSPAAPPIRSSPRIAVAA